MAKLITIYTQAYNVEQYIEQCIKSVISQTYREFEWLLIENGSTDKTREIIKRYAQSDNRIKVTYFDENRTGFSNDYIRDNANGEYIVKLDSDDWLEPEYLEKLIYPMEHENADISICGALDYEQETGKETLHEYGDLEGIYHAEDIRTHFIDMRSYFGTYWGKMFRKELFCRILPKIREAEEKLKAGNYYGGDNLFMLFYIQECKSIMFIKKSMYHYRIHKSGYATRTISTKRLECFFELRNIEKQFLENCNAQTKANELFVDVIFWESMGQLFKHIIRGEWSTEKKIKTISDICSEPKVKKITGETYNSKVRAILVNYIAWCYMNMGNEDGEYIRNMMVLLEPSIYDSISDETYEWMRKDQILMSYIIMGEYLNAQTYLEQMKTADNECYIKELEIRLGSDMEKR